MQCFNNLHHPIQFFLQADQLSTRAGAFTTNI